MDTIENSSHYIILMHHQIFSRIPGIEQFKSNGICEHYAMNCNFATSYFSTEVYPKLIDLERKGIEVVIVVGDSGWDKGVEATCANGITFLASGINNSYYKHKHKERLLKVGRDKVLEFYVIPKERKLEWKFLELNSLAGLTLEEWMDN